MKLADTQSDELSSMLYVAAYGFMLRVPSELLPVATGTEGEADLPLSDGAHSCVSMCGDELVLQLAQRKNKPQGSTLRRGCWCLTRTASLCPVHTLGEWLKQFPRASTPFACTSANTARVNLKATLLQLRVPKAGLFWLHDFRRGHAQDLVEHGGHLHEILAAGQWSSPSFTAYLDLNKVETAGVIETHMDESDADDEVVAH